MMEYLDGLASILCVSLRDLPAEITARGWVPENASEEGAWYTEYLNQDVLSGDSLVPRDTLNPTTLQDLVHWRTLLIIQSHLADRRGLPAASHLVCCLYPEEGHMHL